MTDDPAQRASTAARPLLGEALEFMRLLWAVDHGLHRRSKRMATALGVTGPQRLALRVLGHFPGLSAGDLASVLHLHPSTLTGVLDRLEAKGLIARRADPADRRRVILGLTRAGRRFDVEAAGTIESVVKAALAARSDGEVRGAREVLSTLAARLADGHGDRRPSPARRRSSTLGRRGTLRRARRGP